MNRFQGRAGGILFGLACALLVPVMATQAQSESPVHVGDALPDVIGQDLFGSPTHLSTEVSGKVAVVVFSFSKSGGKDAQLWNRELLRDFGSDRSVELSTVIMLESAPRLLRCHCLQTQKGHATCITQHHNCVQRR